MSCYADEAAIHPEIQVWVYPRPDVADDFALLVALTPRAYVELGVPQASKRLPNPAVAEAFLKMATQQLYRYEKGH